MKNSKINTEKASKTVDQPNLTIAIEQRFSKSKRFLIDNLAPLLFNGLNRFWISLSKVAFVRNFFVNLKEKFMTGGWSIFLVWRRYIDKRLIEVLENYDIISIVNYGAGWDTRLFRLAETQNTRSWKVDQSNNVKSKRQVIEILSEPFNTGIYYVKFCISYGRESAELKSL